MVETTIFLPIKTPSEQREAPPCSPPLCYDMFIKAADSFCPGRPTELPSRGEGQRVKNVPFPHWALWCFKHSAAAESPPGAQRGPHHIQFVKGLRLRTFRETHSLSHTPQKYPHRPPSSPDCFHCLFFYSCARPFSAEARPLTPRLGYKSLAAEDLPRVCELFRCPSLAVFSQKPQGKEKCCRRRTAAGQSPCSTHPFRRVLVVTASSHSPQFDEFEYWVDKKQYHRLLTGLTAKMDGHILRMQTNRIRSASQIVGRARSCSGRGCGFRSLSISSSAKRSHMNDGPGFKDGTTSKPHSPRLRRDDRRIHLRGSDFVEPGFHPCPDNASRLPFDRNEPRNWII